MSQCIVRRSFADDFLTFEEKLDQLLAQKRGLANDMYNGTFDIVTEEFEELLHVPQ
jgi:hypothetical protein